MIAIAPALSALGFDAEWASLVTPTELDAGRVCRVIRGDRGGVLVQGPWPPRHARSRGRLRFEGQGVLVLPTVGDWVVLAEAPVAGRDGWLQVDRVLPRRSTLVRQAAGDETLPQLIAANLDLVLIVTSADGDLNPRRLERYLAVVRTGGANPSIVLTKLDLVKDPDAALRVAREIAGDSPVYAVNPRARSGLHDVVTACKPGMTIACVGSSGVGKSTLINALAGDEHQLTGDVRHSDGKGRHTTTSRELVTLPSGALLIDTPGMREIAPWEADEGVAEAYSDLDDLAATCRFTSCRHETEPGCALRGALDSGELDSERFAGWRRLLSEQETQERLRFAGAAAQERRRYKGLTQHLKAPPKPRR